MRNSKIINATQSLSIGVQLAIAGGFMDAYTYINHGNVFATGQTGNLLLIGIRISEGNYYGAFMAIVPIIFFIIGIFVYDYLQNKWKIQRKDNWQCYILLFEICILYLIGLMPERVPDIFANALIALVSSLQFCSFRILVNGPYASVFCTGNIRSCAEQYYKGIIMKEKEALKSANRYCVVILSFLLGGILSALLSNYLNGKTIWICCLLLTLPFIRLVRINSTIEDSHINL